MVRPMLRTAVAASLLALVIAGTTGCGDDDADGTVTEERTVTETAPAPTETETAPAEPTNEGNHGPTHFQTPSGNIGCYLVAGGVRCDIRERDWTPPPAPAPCELDYGQGIYLDRTGASFVCAGDTTLGGPATLPYGASSQRGRFLCESAEDGVTCTDVNTGTGFFISREDYRIF
jgi:hypothetical protein